MYKEKKTVDAHVHCSPQTDIKYLTDFLDKTDTDMAVIQAVSHSEYLTLIPEALMMKAMAPERFFVFGSPDLCAYYIEREKMGNYLADYVKHLTDIGCDGIKMLEGKPQMRKKYPIPDFDDKCWEEYWKYVEENQVPVTFHMNDPENFWDANTSEWIKKQGWWYDDSFVNNEKQYTQILNVLERHTNLKIVFAHFFFMSSQLDRLDHILEKYPKIMVDITPGIEMYENFSSHYAEAKSFFTKHNKRIIYGTDIGGRCILTNEQDKFNEKENLRRPVIVREFLGESEEREIRSDGNFLIQREPFVMHPLGLQDELLENILSENILRITGPLPRKINKEALINECFEWKKKVISMRFFDQEKEFSTMEIEKAEKFFRTI